MGKDEAGDDGGTVCGEGEVFRGRVCYPFCACKHAGFEEGAVGVWEGEGGTWDGRFGEDATGVDGVCKG